MILSLNKNQSVLPSNGIPSTEEVRPNRVHIFLGKIARAIESCFGHKTPFVVSLYAELSKNKNSFTALQGDLWQERMRVALKCLPYLGVAIGLGAGLSSRGSFSYVSKVDCKNGFFDSPFLQAINEGKQWEIKNMAYLTPFLVPAFFHWKKHFDRIEWGFFKDKIVQVITTKGSLEGESNSGKFCVKGIEAFFKAFTKRIVYTGSLLILGLGNPIYTLASRILFRGFDLSGHFLMKTVSAALLSQELHSLGKTKSKKKQIALLGYAACFAFSDAVLLYNTAARCHTVAEVFFGLGAGISIVRLAKHLHDKTTLVSPLDV